MVIWYIFLVLVSCIKKNLATLRVCTHLRRTDLSSAVTATAETSYKTFQGAYVAGQAAASVYLYVGAYNVGKAHEFIHKVP
jgi:hypothetical protein